ncbi:unnamed protein product [Closterium sp. NIES-64]|nr:unnamed protein product [Closterium sp. NIES-64]
MPVEPTKAICEGRSSSSFDSGANELALKECSGLQGLRNPLSGEQGAGSALEFPATFPVLDDSETVGEWLASLDYRAQRGRHAHAPSQPRQTWVNGGCNRLPADQQQAPSGSGLNVGHPVTTDLSTAANPSLPTPPEARLPLPRVTRSLPPPAAPPVLRSAAPPRMATGGGLFGSTAGSSLFGQPQQTTPAAPSLFGQQTPATPSPFGQQTQAAAAPSLFGQTTPATPSPFGQSAPAFGAASTPAFGASPTSAFGAASTSAFGATPTSAFGAASTSAFGASSTPAFGAASTPAFGASASPFGATTTSAFGATPTSAFGAASSTPGFGGQLTLSQPQQQQQGALQQAQFAAQSAQWSGALPEREVAAIAAAYFGDARNPLGRFVSPFLSVTHPLARFRPPNVPELTWQEAIRLLAAAGPENQADGLWPEMVCGFSGLSKRLQVQDETIEADRQRLDAVEAAVGQVRAHVTAVTEGRQGAVRQRQQQLQQRVLRLMRLVEIMELRTSPHVPLSPTELLLSDRLQSLLRLLCSGASELPRKVESLAAAASMLADGGGEGGGADTGAGGAGGGVREGGGVRVEEWSMERMRGVVATQAEAVGRLAQLVERDVRDVGIMMGGGGVDPIGGVAGA